MFSKQGELDLARVLKALIDAGDIEPRSGFRGGQLVDHGPAGVRQGYAKKTQSPFYRTVDVQLTEDTIEAISKYNKIVKDAYKKGDLSEVKKFRTWAIDTYGKKDGKPIIDKMENIKVRGVGTQGKLSQFQPHDLIDFKARLVTKLVDDAIAEPYKFTEQQDIIKKIRKTEAVHAGKDDPFSKFIRKEAKRLSKLASKEKKVHNVLNDLWDGTLKLKVSKDFYKKFPGYGHGGDLSKIIAEHTGIRADTTVEPFIKSYDAFKGKDGKEALKIFRSQLSYRDFSKMNLSDALEYTAERAGGSMRFTGQGSSVRMVHQDPNVFSMQSAMRSWNNNHLWDLDSPIQFYKKGDFAKGKSPIEWKAGKKINMGNVEFTYNNKAYSMDDLMRETVNYKQGKFSPFKHLYDTHKDYRIFMDSRVPHPTESGTITMRKLFEDAGHTGMAIEHGKGVAKGPFTNLKVMSQSMNNALGAVYKNFYGYPKLRQLLTDTITKNLPHAANANYLDALQKGEYELAEQMIKNKTAGIPSVYRESAKQIMGSKHWKDMSLNERTLITKATFGGPGGTDYRRFDKPAIQTILEKDISGKKATKQIKGVLAGWCNKGSQKVKEGGRIGFAGCPDSEKITNVKNAAAKLKDPMWRVNNPVAARELAKRIAQSGTALTKLGRFAFGPWTLWGEPLFEAAFVAHDMLGNGTPWKEAVAKSLWAIPAVKMGLLKPADQQYEEALYQVQGEEGRVRTGVKRFMDNSKKIDELNRLEKMVHTSHIAGKGPLGERTPEARTARVEAAQKRYKDYLESLGGVKGVRDIKNQIEKDREAYDTRVDALKIEREGMTKEKMFIGDQKRMTIERAAEKKQEKAMADLMYQKHGKVKEGDDWVVDPDLKDKWFPEPVMKPEELKTLLQIPTEESWSPHYPKTIHDMFPTPSSRYGWSQMGPIAEAGGVSKMAGGGLANLTRTVAPDSGPVSRGLRSLYIDDMD